MQQWWTEIRRRQVAKVATGYLVIAWLIVQVASIVLPAFDAPAWVLRVLILLLALGFAASLVLAWVYEWTGTDGLKRDRDRRMSRSVVGVAVVLSVVAIGWFLQGLSMRESARPKASAHVAPSPAPATRAAPNGSIAVLPFVNMSEDAANAYFSEGISEELLNLLAQVPELRVTARTSSFSFKGKNVSIREIADALGVRHVLEGSVRKSGDRVRITAQLIEASSDRHVWSRAYDRRLDDIFAIQDEIAADVVKHLRVTLLGEAPTARKTDPQAYAFYLQAVHLARGLTAETLRQSHELLDRALAIDPQFAPAWDRRASNYIVEAGIGARPSAESYRRAAEAVARALELDPGYASAWARRGRIATDLGDLPAAAADYERALQLDPTNAIVMGGSAALLLSLGRLDQAIALQQAVVELDPVNVGGHYNLAYTLRLAGRPDAALEQLRVVLRLNPRNGGARYQVAMAMVMQGGAAGALAELEQESSDAFRMIGLPIVYHALGQAEASDGALAALVAKYEQDAAYNIAYVLAFRGETDAAFEWLEKAVRYGDSGLHQLPVENLFANIHADPRWLPLLRRLGKAPEQLGRVAFDARPARKASGIATAP